MRPQAVSVVARPASSLIRSTFGGSLLAAMLALGCAESPSSFREVSLEDARRLIAAGDVTIVDALAEDSEPAPALAGGLRWKVAPTAPNLPPGLPDGAVLIIGSSPGLGYGSAAALARTGRRPVYVFITRSRRERNALVAVALRSREASDGRDS
ncbi:MAG: hypothetical protein HRU00_00575 [Myxococcales bacterium]|nr:hypothetical protein [Myxococcales bacterium]